MSGPDKTRSEADLRAAFAARASQAPAAEDVLRRVRRAETAHARPTRRWSWVTASGAIAASGAVVAGIVALAITAGNDSSKKNAARNPPGLGGGGGNAYSAQRGASAGS